MGKYIYGKFSADIVPHSFSNEFHSLSMFLGAYLMYSQEVGNDDFGKYVKQNHLLYKELGDKTVWSYVNRAHAFIRDRINSAELNDKKHVSRKQIRKLGYCGIGKPAMYPLCGLKIQKEMFELVFFEDNLAQVKVAFLNYLAEKWRETESTGSYLSCNGGNAATRNTFRKFIRFQYAVLSQSPKGESIIPKLLANETYGEIQKGLDERG